MFLDVDGEVVALGAASRAGLALRLEADLLDAEVTALVIEGAEVVVVSVEEIAPLRSLLGRWHADQGVLRDDLRVLQDALAAAACRQSLLAQSQRL
jgi:hypothetical protein